MKYHYLYCNSPFTEVLSFCKTLTKRSAQQHTFDCQADQTFFDDSNDKVIYFGLWVMFSGSRIAMEVFQFLWWFLFYFNSRVSMQVFFSFRCLFSNKDQTGFHFYLLLCFNSQYQLKIQHVQLTNLCFVKSSINYLPYSKTFHQAVNQNEV